MKQLAYLGLVAALLVLLSGCGSAEVDETQLPTRVPTIDPASFAVTVAPPTATPAPTSEPTVEPTPAPTTAADGQSEDAQSDDAVEATPAGGTDEDSGLADEATDIITGTTGIITDTEVLPTPTVGGMSTTEITVTVAVSPTMEITDTSDLAESELITDTGTPEEPTGETDPSTDASEEAGDSQVDASDVTTDAAPSTSTHITETGFVTATDAIQSSDFNTDTVVIEQSQTQTETQITAGEELDATSGEEVTDEPDDSAENSADTAAAEEDPGEEDMGEEESVDPEATGALTSTSSVTITAGGALSLTEEITATQSTTESEQAEEANAGTGEEPASASEDDALDVQELPTGVAAALEDADPANGQQLSLVNACIGCHSMDPDQTMVGPTWYNIAETAPTRVEGQDAELYLYNSIVYPNAYVNEGYLPNIMIQTYGQTLSEQDLADIIAYLLSLDPD